MVAEGEAHKLIISTTTTTPPIFDGDLSWLFFSIWKKKCGFSVFCMFCLIKEIENEGQEKWGHILARPS